MILSFHDEYEKLFIVEILGLRCWHGAPRQMPGAHAHNEIEINFVARGSLIYLFGGAAVPVEQGQLALFWATVPHQLITLEKSTELAWVT
ncbi:MAG: cupin domain-containing protein, partial [Armatimonadota bacterium]|nr:cupin domain-containing protein [Armatimonadota bacterium]